ncbi:glycosyltransferase family 4 protein [Candidatus Synechococcus calcipolaris G9]|uniref:Glycosyltransferase family 4 protein n=1 Tax=Candidatus Synechococcus calcipolaris G9 TaxID=1497997 RepID=A0ABT6EX31_9SYNE|nr:glycosyltransferase family 4 protein [Candidatus Synechococcus calcipolaris]MDG2990287.1 glycosyltransferase family 4 protein [Candidatus Synechococcus calcipolaris G9]
MTHILYVLPYLGQGGTEKQALSLIQALGDRYDLSLLAPDGPGAAPFRALSIPQATFTRWDFNFFKGFFEVLRALRAMHRQKKIDLVHIHGAHELMIPCRWVLRHTPMIFTVHGYHGSGALFSYRTSAWLSQWLAQGVITVCQAEDDLLRRFGLAGPKRHLIYNGVPQPKLEPEKTRAWAQTLHLQPDQQLIIGTAARLNPVKGLTYLIQAFAQLSGEHLRLVIAGTGDLEADLKQEADDLGVGDRTIFTGYVADLANLMQVFDIFVLPSLEEACSLACAEAMAQGKPIVGTNVGGIPEQVADKINGFIVPPQDATALAEKLGQLVADPELRHRFGQNSGDRYRDNFSLATMVAQTTQLYDQFIQP